MLGFDEFLRSQLDPLIRYSQILCGNREEAHDLLADALLGAHQRWHRIGGMEFPAAYVRSMVTSRHISNKRQTVRRQRQLTLVGHSETAVVRGGQSVIDDRSELATLLAELPARQRAAVVLRYYFDLSDEAIAEELGIGTSSVRSSIARALIALRRNTNFTPGGE